MEVKSTISHWVGGLVEAGGYLPRPWEQGAFPNQKNEQDLVQDQKLEQTPVIPSKTTQGLMRAPIPPAAVKWRK